jgi:predicted small lipoprotein YifL
MQVKQVALMAASAALLMTGCGKKGPLIYPDMLIAQPPQQLKVEQRGSALRLSFDLPDKDRSGRKLQDLEAILIGRRVYQENDCVSCQDQYQAFQKVDPAFPAPAQRQGNRLVVVDTDVRNGERYQYRLQTVQKGGITGSVTTTAMVKLLAAPHPPELKARSAFGGFISLDLASVAQQDAALVGYTIYRGEGAGALVPLTTLTGGTTHYEDQAVQRGVTYRYAASVVVKRADGMLAESEPSAAVAISVADDPS